MSQLVYEYLILGGVLGIIIIPLVIIKVVASYLEKKRQEDLEWWSSQEIRDN